MNRLALIVLTCCLMIEGQINLAHAHMPYFTQREKFVLPDGQIGEMRLLHGDGIIASDPVRLIVLDSSDRLIGYSNEIFSKHSIICSADRKCVGYRHSDNTILEFARSTPYIGPVVTSGESAGLWRERDDQINIEARKPKVSEFGIANYQLAMRSNPFSFVIAIVGLLMGMSLSLFWHWVIRSRQGVIFRLLGSIITLGVECVLIVWGFFYLFIIGEFSFIRWLISLCLGAMSGIAMVNLVLRKTKPTAVSS